MSNNRTAFFLSALQDLKSDCAPILGALREDRTLGYEARTLLIGAVHEFMRRRILEIMNDR